MGRQLVKHSGLLGALSLSALACAQIIGIEDTEVTRLEGAVGGSGGSGGAGGAVPPLGGSGGGGSQNVGGSSAASGGSAATGGDGLGGSPSEDAGVVADAATPDCAEGSARCVSGVRESCVGGIWQGDPCPVTEPICEGDGECVVRGPALVQVAGSFFVDSTEVTVDQYTAFLLATAGDVSGQPPECSWNTDYWDDSMPMDLGNNPVTMVDWCDARAFCAWAGKRLCGSVGGGAIARDAIFTPAASQWYLACGGPNGGTAVNNDALCNSNGGFGGLAPVGTFPGCEGYYPGLFDMQGNAAEWIDSCDGATGPSDTCYLMGGSYVDNQSYCDEVYSDATEPYTRDTRAITFGFRCCSG